jgi:hypothetical protein
MKNPPFRSPREKVGGMYHFGRMLDKVRLHVRGELPDEYKPNLGLALGLDGHCCAFLEVEFVALVERIKRGGTDDEILEWCFTTGHRPNAVQQGIWNAFTSKMGWNDDFSPFMEAVKAEDGLANRDDLKTIFAVMDFREGRVSENHDLSL